MFHFKQRTWQVLGKHLGKTPYDGQKLLNLADELWENYCFDDALELDTLTIDLAESSIGKDHIYTLRLKGNLAAVLYQNDAT